MQYDDGQTFENIAQLSDLANTFPNKTIYIAETAYPASGSQQYEKNYPATQQGQLAYIKDAFEAFSKVCLPCMCCRIGTKCDL